MTKQQAGGAILRQQGIVCVDTIAQKAAASKVRQVEVSLAGTGIDIVTDPAAILALGDAWQALEAQCPDTVFFQSFAWCRNFLEFSVGNPNFAPRVITLRDKCADGGSRLVGILPLALQKKGQLKVLTGFAEPFQQYTDILLDPSVRTAGLICHLLAALKKTGADYVHFGQVREDSALARIANGILLPLGERDAAPYIRLSQFENHDEYHKTVRSKTRKNLRNARNRLERDAPVTHETAWEGPLLSEVIERAYEGREAWLERLGITSRAFQDEDFEAFLKRFSDATEPAVNAISTIAMSLKHGDKPISDQWGFVYRGRYYAFMANWNPEYEASSPGRLHLGEVIRTCFEEGFETADFLIPASSYKLSWTDDMMPVCDLVLPLTRKGSLYARLWLGFIRPRAKQLFFRLPAGLRQLLVKKVVPMVE